MIYLKWATSALFEKDAELLDPEIFWHWRFYAWGGILCLSLKKSSTCTSRCAHFGSQCFSRCTHDCHPRFQSWAKICATRLAPRYCFYKVWEQKPCCTCYWSTFSYSFASRNDLCHLCHPEHWSEMWAAISWACCVVSQHIPTKGSVLSPMYTTGIDKSTKGSGPKNFGRQNSNEWIIVD